MSVISKSIIVNIKFKIKIDIINYKRTYNINANLVCFYAKVLTLSIKYSILLLHL